MSDDVIRIRGARQNNLKGLDLELPLGELIVVTGVSGSGKSSLAFDTIYAEGQRRYVETFSPYARQFLDRMDKPRVDRIEGIPPAIAIDQTNPVRTSRSTVATMTELSDYLKLLFARAARLYCGGCGRPVVRDSPESVADQLLADPGPAAQPILITFPVGVQKGASIAQLVELLGRQGYDRIQRRSQTELEVIQDRLKLEPEGRGRLVEDLEAAFEHGGGRVSIYPLERERRPGDPLRFSAQLHCARCDIHYRDPLPNLFSFNSPLGACESCRGFGRTMGIDYGLVVPDQSKSLAAGAIKPWQTESYRECQDDLIRYAKRRGIAVQRPWSELDQEQRRWVLEGEGDWEDRKWYGVRRFFDWLETKSYKMHIRVLLSKYRSYDRCRSCDGARLKAQALLWRLGAREDAERALGPARRFRPAGLALSDGQLDQLPGLCIHDLMLLPLERARGFFDALRPPAPLDQPTELLLTEIRARLRYLVEVGVGYLTLDRQSRTLSGGEVQRINLTTALGTSLVSALFVLDEPSIGMHARDLARVIGVLHRLRDAGNSLLVVEHDPQVMRAADRLLDLGPGPGERGGELVYYGPPAQIGAARRSRTGLYLSGRKTVRAAVGLQPRAVDAAAPRLEIVGAAEHNLKAIDVSIPLGRLVCITGVSGSGKSTLVEDVLYHGLRKLQGRPEQTPGRHQEIRGHETIGQVLLIDQSPIGKTARSNPASYVGALDAIRKAFAAQPLARQRGYSTGSFSFNSDRGGCPTCGGSGFEHVEMQFLSDVYLRCPDCDGRRYRPEVLEVKLPPLDRPRGGGRAGAAGLSIADVLDLTAEQATQQLADSPALAAALEPLIAVGLGYMKLGQPVPTLSGGEAQRLKLAGQLAGGSVRAGRGGSAGVAPATNLFLFDEPTTGLHFDDIAQLLGAFARLVDQGHSLIVIEHNLDVIRAADWIIDLGPEGGDGGGRIVCEGTPRDLEACARSHTGAALRAESCSARSAARAAAGAPAPPAAADPVARRGGSIEIRHAREHNLKNVDIRIPRRRFTVITGISGSGKSTVAFDILFAEGQRRYLESLNAYARQFVEPAARPDVDAVFGIPPTVAIEQRTSRGGRKSTVATQTELYHFLRLLYAKLGVQHCPDCDRPIEPQSAETILGQIQRRFRGRRMLLLAPLVVGRKGYYTDLAKWAKSKGFAQLRVDGALLPTGAWPRLTRFKEHDIELPLGEFVIGSKTAAALRGALSEAFELGRGVVKLAPNAPAGRMRKGSQADAVFSIRRACPRCGRSFEELDPRLFSFNSKRGWCPSCYGTGLELEDFDADQSGEEAWWNAWWQEELRPCAACGGRRLNPEALAVRFRGRSIAELSALSVAAAEEFFARLKLRGREAALARDLRSELRSRLAFLRQVGLSYLALDRSAPSLSGGEAQRIRLAAQLGSNLRGVCYILDEPTIGLHTRDHRMLLATLERLRAKGNTVVVVEHDEETIRRAEHLIDLGPGAGVHGGRVVAAGSLQDLLASPDSITGRCLKTPLPHPLPGARDLRVAESDAGAGAAIEIRGARLHNLKHLNVAIPLRSLVCVTGVSGSGKSTLVRELLHDHLVRLLGERRSRRSRDRPPRFFGCDEIRGWESIDRVLEVDQTPIGKTPRSCPATYVGFWDSIRRVFAGTLEARLRGYGPSRFSFNVHGGRCDACEGQGLKKIEMSFLPDVRVACEVCSGARFNAETLAVRFKERSVAEVLAMSVDEAAEFFAAQPGIHRALELLRDVGLGYLSLGQQSPSLSGGEAQRIKLVTELAKVRAEPSADAASVVRTRPAGRPLYILDEPTIGLHMADVEQLIRVLHRLVDAGGTVVVIEHNLDVIAEADWIIDLGPEGGAGGGRIVAQGPPAKVARQRRGSHTAAALRPILLRGQFT